MHENIYQIESTICSRFRMNRELIRRGVNDDVVIYEGIVGNCAQTNVKKLNQLIGSMSR